MPNPLHSDRYQVFRNMLVAQREQVGLTQVQVANLLGKPQSFVSKYERGERRLDFTEFVELAAVLKIDHSEFLRRYQLAVQRT